MKVVSDYKNLVENQQSLLKEKEKSVKDFVDLICKFREEMEKVDKKLREKFCPNCKNEFEKIFKY